MNQNEHTYDVTIIGGGILGVSIAYWLSLIYEGSIAVIDREVDVAGHASSRNTGVVHRPFYLHPQNRKIFAQCANLSYPLWKKYARFKNLPWKEVGTLEVATTPATFEKLKRYAQWAVQNGMDSTEVEILSGAQAKNLEPHIECVGALLCKTDTAVDFGLFTRNLRDDAKAGGVQFIHGHPVQGVSRTEDGLVRLERGGGQPPITTRFVINCAGASSLRIAHLFGVAHDIADLYFRGEYWNVSASATHFAQRNIYSYPTNDTFPFLDPHWIRRFDGRVEIGPNAVPVLSPYAYHGISQSGKEFFQKIFEPPIANKFRLTTNPEFLRLAYHEWKSSVSKKEMAKRVQAFLPELTPSDLVSRSFSGVRAMAIDSRGTILKEALRLSGTSSFHIINYNSPGATGAPVFAASVISHLGNSGMLDHLPKRKVLLSFVWSYQEIIAALHAH